MRSKLDRVYEFLKIASENKSQRLAETNIIGWLVLGFWVRTVVCRHQIHTRSAYVGGRPMEQSGQSRACSIVYVGIYDFEVAFHEAHFAFSA